MMIQLTDELAFEKLNNTYYLNADQSFYDAHQLLYRLRDADDFSSPQLLSEEDTANLLEKINRYSNKPNFKMTKWGSVTHALLCYLANNEDEDMLNAVRQALALKTNEEIIAYLLSQTNERQSLIEFWMAFSKELLTSEGFEEFHFGKLTSSSDGCYLYNDESVFAFISISSKIEPVRKVELIVPLLANPEAVSEATEALQVQWCFYLDDLLTEKKSVSFLNGTLRAINPYGKESKLMRRYSLTYASLNEIELASKIKVLKKTLENYPS